MIDYSNHILESCLNTPTIEEAALSNPFRYMNNAIYESMVLVSNINLKILSENYIYLKENGEEDKNSTIAKIITRIKAMIKWAKNKIYQFYIAVKKKATEVYANIRKTQVIKKLDKLEKENKLSGELDNWIYGQTIGIYLNIEDMKNSKYWDFDFKSGYKTQEITDMMKSTDKEIRTDLTKNLHSFWARSARDILNAISNPDVKAIDTMYKEAINNIKKCESELKSSSESSADILKYIQDAITLTLRVYKNSLNIIWGNTKYLYKTAIDIYKHAMGTSSERITGTGAFGQVSKVDREHLDGLWSDFVDDVMNTDLNYGGDDSEEGYEW